MTTFLIGFALGALAGLFVSSLCVAASRNSEPVKPPDESNDSEELYLP